MTTYALGSVAVIFVAQRMQYDEDVSSEAAMGQVGYSGLESVCRINGLGMTISYWADELSAKQQRERPEHITAPEFGRKKWYSNYSMRIAAISRGYDWTKTP